MAMLPHRYPFLMVDRIIDMQGDDYCVGIKNITVNEPQFQGHFPGQPVMPGVLLIEGMAQTAGVLCIWSREEQGIPKIVYLMLIDKVRFKRPVVPGDSVRYVMRKQKRLGTVWRFAAEARVDDRLVAEAEITAKLVY